MSNTKKKTEGQDKKDTLKRGSTLCVHETPFPDGAKAPDAGSVSLPAMIEYVRVSSIDDSEDGNPRKINKKNFERLKQSITDNPDFFEARPLLLNRVDGALKIIGGHQRLKAAKALGMYSVPAYVFDGLDEDKAKRFTILDNTNEGAWDWEKLKQFSVEIDLQDFNVSIPESIDYEKIAADNVLKAIMYKPSSKEAKVSEFLDNELYDRVANEVRKMDVPEELKEFVEIRLANFRRIRFDKVADYYARADEKTKQLFRQLALVFDVSGTTFEQDILDFYRTGLQPDAYE